MAIIHANQWGSSLGLRLPKAICQHLSIEKNTALLVREEKNKIIIEVIARPKKNLMALVDKITDDNKHQDDYGDPVGKEIW